MSISCEHHINHILLICLPATLQLSGPQRYSFVWYPTSQGLCSPLPSWKRQSSYFYNNVLSICSLFQQFLTSIGRFRYPTSEEWWSKTKSSIGTWQGSTSGDPTNQGQRCVLVSVCTLKRELKSHYSFTWRSIEKFLTQIGWQRYPTSEGQHLAISSLWTPSRRQQKPFLVGIANGWRTFQMWITRTWWTRTTRQWSEITRLRKNRNDII